MFPLVSIFAPPNYSRAALLSLVVFAWWPLGDAFLKMVGESHVPMGEVFLICGLSSMAAIFVTASLCGKRANLRPRNWRGLVALGSCQIVSFSFWLLALPLLPLGNAYIFSFLTPMFVACLAVLFLKEPLGWKRALSIGAGFCGVVIAIQPSSLFQPGGHLLAYLFLFGNMLGSATQMFLLRLVSTKESCESTVFYSRAILASCGLFLCFINGFVPIEPWAVLAICGSGVIGGLGWSLLAQAYKFAPASFVAPFQYTQLVWGALVGYLLWKDLPSMSLVLGSAVIILSNLYNVRDERRISRTMPRVD